MYDLVIVGGGPSGSAAGRVAGKAGLKTLLIEKEDFPRYKPCGGALSDHAINYLDFDIPGEIIEKEIYGCRICFHDQAIESFKDYRISVLVTRSKLDNFLLENAKETGIEVHLNEKVTSISNGNDHVIVCTNRSVYEARFVIIATGSQDSLKNTVRRKDNKKEYGICIVTEVEEDKEVINEYIRNGVELRFGVAGRGYGWIFPHDNHYSVGIGGVAGCLPDPKSVIRDFLKENGFMDKYDLKGHVIPCGGYKRNIIDRRILLSGDAAGFVDAFTGEGLAYAIRSGQIAAEVISDIVRSGSGENVEQLKEYERKCYLEFGEHLKYSLTFARIMHNFPGSPFKIFTKEKEIIDQFLEVVAFRSNYKQYLKWILFNFRPGWILKGLS
ncbi:MAG: geranylgeranyl reductase family protein [Methanosarcinaceae archaeon]|nr:geranylgeranyl reductase family protein [Methanosarcinaceae archaeon]